jgi:hypothetical protein
MSKLENNPPYQIIKPIFLGEIVRNNLKTVFMLGCFFFILGPFWAPPNGPKKVPEGPQVSGMYGPMSELKNKPLTKLLGPFF